MAKEIGKWKWRKCDYFTVVGYIRWMDGDNKFIHGQNLGVEGS